MLTFKQIFIIVTTGAVIISCGYTRNIDSGIFTKKDNYRVNNYSGCCGCTAQYFNIYHYKKRAEQIVYSYNCYAKGLPTKFVFNYNKIGHLINCDKYIATINDDFIMPVNKNEKILFSLMDADTVHKFARQTIKYDDIKGFRKALGNEITHSFPLKRKGNKVKIN